MNKPLDIFGLLCLKKNTKNKNGTKVQQLDEDSDDEFGDTSEHPPLAQITKKSHVLRPLMKRNKGNLKPKDLAQFLREAEFSNNKVNNCNIHF